MKIVDLTLSIQEGMFVYPGDPDVELEQFLTLEKDGWNMKRIHMNGHDGTHVNAPIHCVKDGKTLDDLPIEHFCGECVLYEKEEDIQAGIGVVFREQISKDVAEYVVKVQPKFVGLVLEADEEIEKYLLENGIILFERLTNVDDLPRQFMFYGVPLKIKEGDGSPVRAFAVSL